MDSITGQRTMTTTPLFSHLVEFVGRGSLQFHIPAHKGGRGMDDAFRAFVGENALAIDLINIAPLDDLHRPHGVLLEAERLAAQAFQADYTYFSVQGTSTAIVAMILATCGPGDKILVPRNAHRSVATALILSGAHPIYMDPEIDPRIGIAHGIEPETLRRSIAAHPDAKAVLVVNPTYYGVCQHLNEIVAIAHDHNLIVLVDEAHGAHFYFHPKLPASAMEAGADMAATSMHKMGGSLTQSSVLNLKGTRVDPAAVRSILSLLTTTSTSYLLLASLDAARRHMATEGKRLLSRTIELAEAARRRINEVEGLYCFGAELVASRKSVSNLDPSRLCVTVRGTGIDGLEYERRLRDRFRVEVELSDLYNVLFLVTIADTERETLALVDSLAGVCPNGTIVDSLWYPPDLPPYEQALTPREAFYAPKTKVPLAESGGRVAAEWISVYPPGIPIITPGERITAEHLDHIRRHLYLGYPIQGPIDPTLRDIYVVATHPS